MKDEKICLYIKANQMVETTKASVTIQDILTMECIHLDIRRAVSQMEIIKFPKGKYQRTVISVLTIIEKIHQEYPNLQIVNMGCIDIIVAYENQKTPNKIWHTIKAGIVTVITFTGSAYSIMAFTNDVDTLSIFDQLYELITGVPPEGLNVLQLSYCIGLILGILVFFNHFGKKKVTVDPTPMEIEMRLYEQDIQTTLIENYARKGREIEVGNTDNFVDHRH